MSGPKGGCSSVALVSSCIVPDRAGDAVCWFEKDKILQAFKALSGTDPKRSDWWESWIRERTVRHAVVHADSRGHDDCPSEFHRLRSAQDDFESAVSSYQSDCG
jgi:hypothetical protein